jgi:hypothetical protein
MLIVQSFRFKVEGSKFQVQSFRFKVDGSKFKVQNSKFVMHIILLKAHNPLPTTQNSQP